VIVRNQLELDILNISIVHIHMRKAEIDIFAEPDLLEFVGQVIVVGDGQEALGIG